MEKRIKKIADVSEDIANLKFSSEDMKIFQMVLKKFMMMTL